jgi:hypothetical protein
MSCDMSRRRRSDEYGPLRIRILVCTTILTSVRVKFARCKGRRQCNRTCISDRQLDKELGGTWVLTTRIFETITDGPLSHCKILL